MLLTEICGHIIDTDLIIGVSPLMKTNSADQVSMQFSFTVYLRYYPVIIKATWIDVYDKTEEKQKTWDEIRIAHFEVSELLKKTNQFV